MGERGTGKFRVPYRESAQMQLYLCYTTNAEVEYQPANVWVNPQETACSVF